MQHFCRGVAGCPAVERGNEEVCGAFFHPCLALLVPPVDRSAWLLSDTEVQNQCFPPDVQADGSCLFGSTSLLLFGSDRHHAELRCSTVLGMATNPTAVSGRQALAWCA